MIKNILKQAGKIVGIGAVPAAAGGILSYLGFTTAGIAAGSAAAAAQSILGSVVAGSWFAIAQ